MINNYNDHQKISFENLMKAYRNGVFPMAENFNSLDVFWVEPKKRGIIELQELKISRKLKKLIRVNKYEIRINTNFQGVIEGCANIRSAREDTWINGSIIDAYIDLHFKGHAHSVESYLNNTLVGGLYGVSIGGVFFGESMFSIAKDASKIALIHLLERLKIGEYYILDTQFITNHLKFFGAKEISQKFFMQILKDALKIKADFFKLGPVGSLNRNNYPKIENFI
tara:strand:+ start:9939 stop:10613 length:675 start_codon:yes stop_codon:yes gene_type:complete